MSSCNSQLCFLGFGFKSSRNPSKRNLRLRRLPTISNSTTPQPDSQEEKEGEDAAAIKRDDHSQDIILVERYGNGTGKRYVLNDNFQVQSFFEEHGAVTNGLQATEISTIGLSWLPYPVREFILPAGFPESVSDDYLEYMFLQFPTNVTAWICNALVTSSLLKAVGVGSFSGTTAAASAAAIRWVSKDGIGALGRLFIGGRFGNLFDDDPKQWRMYADFIGSAGSIFDLSTQLYPVYFLPLASLGNLAKAIARGLKDPSFRVIQNHFSLLGNLGEVAAKEEVWEVAAQLLGLGLGILFLDTPGISSSYPALATTWLSMRLLHLWLRYQSLSVLQFDTINMKRARILAKYHVSYSTVPGKVDCNKAENILSWQRFLKPRILFGVSLEEMLGHERSPSKVRILLGMYKKENHILMMNRQQHVDLEVYVSFKVGATSLSVLRSIWQTYWLQENWHESENAFNQLEQSLSALDHGFDNFIQQLEGAGWDTSQITLKVPKELSIQEIDPI
ncbi:Root UVB sensitive family [Dillenia turbinata]|uniref:Root UVB sensitive family n=1 Tax=Dillenia turbinata TaxID=194707 RepID=A0AAN8W859_9MAGN